MDNAITIPAAGAQPLATREFGRDELDIIRNVIAKGATDTELKMFVIMAGKLGLDPLSKQIHMVKRRVKHGDQWVDVMTIVVGIDGYRLVAERTGRYCPGRAPTYEYDAHGAVTSATAYVLKLAGGAWHEVSAVAFWEEYAQLGRDGKPTAMWARMPRLMLAKCAEALALRRAFPAELAGVYTDDEMAQASNDAPAAPVAAPVVQPVVIDAPKPTPTAPMPLIGDVRDLGIRAKRALEADLPQHMRDGLVQAMDLARAALKSGAVTELTAARDALSIALTGEPAEAQPA